MSSDELTIDRTKLLLNLSAAVLVVSSYIYIEYSDVTSLANNVISATSYIIGLSLFLYASIYTREDPMDVSYILKKMDIIIIWVFLVSFGMYLHISGYGNIYVFFISWLLFSVSLFLFYCRVSKKSKNRTIFSQSGSILVVFSIFMFVWCRENSIFREEGSLMIKNFQNLSLLMYTIGWFLLGYSLSFS